MIAKESDKNYATNNFFKVDGLLSKTCYIETKKRKNTGENEWVVLTVQSNGLDWTRRYKLKKNSNLCVAICRRVSTGGLYIE